MLDLDIGPPMPEGFARQHLLAAFMAAVASLALHAAAIYLLPEIRFHGVSAPLHESARPRERPMRVMDVTPPDITPATWTALTAGQPAGVELDRRDLVDEHRVPPAEALLEPPPVIAGTLEEPPAHADARPAPPRAAWEPRQEILMITEPVAAVEIPAFARRPVSRIERVPQAPDVVASIDRDRIGKPGGRYAVSPLEALQPAGVDGAPARGRGADGARTASALVIGEAAAESGSGLFSETLREITAFQPIENRLRATVSTYTTLRDFRHQYFRIEIERQGAEDLPVLAKDVVFVQDCSASMTEQRLHFCREGLRQCLSRLGPDDRFNVVSFRDRPERLAEGWLSPDAASVRRAQTFIDNMTAGGSTDIFGSMQELIKLPRTSGRPVIALLATDGVPTAGLVDSADIIGEFSKLNNGGISVFSLATVQTADRYLLDLLSYCNRGDALSVAGGRWGIPGAMLDRMRALSRPVLTDLRIYFADDDGNVDVYPRQTSNLYLDRALVLYGRCRRATQEVVFQVFGLAETSPGDMVFAVALKDAQPARDIDLREEWAKQKVYHLMGEYARSQQDATLEAIRATARAYGVRIPHKRRLRE